jgi:hypothetical protein
VSIDQKAIIDNAKKKIGSVIYHSRSLRARHVMKEEVVNVGDPGNSHEEGVSTDKPKQQGSREGCQEVR